MNPTAIEFHHVWKKFQKGQTFDTLRDIIPALIQGVFRKKANETLTDMEFWAVRDVSFQVEQGEAFGIIGPNGAGKSSMLKLLSGILTPTRGETHVRGRLGALIELGAGFHGDLTGRENVYLNATIIGMKKKEIDQKFDEIVAFSGIEEFLDTPVKRYSSGMNARLGFSVAIHTEPDVLLVDEVLSVGDMGFQAKCIEKLKNLIAGGTAVVFVSHNVRQVAMLCRRILVLSHGQVLHVGDANQALKIYHAQVNGKPNQSTTATPASDAKVIVKTMDANGRAQGALPFGEAILLEVTCHLPATVPEASVMVKIGHYQYSDRDLFSLASIRGGVTLKPGDTKLVCRLDPCRLLPNTYRVRAFITDVTTGRALASFPHQEDLVIGMPSNDLAVRLPNPDYALLDAPAQWGLST